MNNFKPKLILEPGGGGGQDCMQTSQVPTGPSKRGGRALRPSKPHEGGGEGGGWVGEEGGCWWWGGDGGKEEGQGGYARQPSGGRGHDGQIPLGFFYQLSPSPAAPALRLSLPRRSLTTTS